MDTTFFENRGVDMDKVWNRYPPNSKLDAHLNQKRWWTVFWAKCKVDGPQILH